MAAVWSSLGRIELVPARGIVPQAIGVLAPSTEVAVTCLPHHGLTASVETSLELVAGGLTPITHLAAKRFESTHHLKSTLDALESGGVRNLFAVGGDGVSGAGPFRDGGDLLAAIAKHSTAFKIGVAGYPEYLQSANGADHIAAVAAKSSLADYIVTQVCFDPVSVVRYLDTLHRAGIDLQVWVGVPAPISTARLLRLSTRIGVRTSVAIASKVKGSHRLALGTFDARGHLSQLAEALEGRSIAGLHVYSFNDLLAARTLLKPAGDEEEAGGA
jgi:methylenetetrahydrofolate reductase (NADPH)